MKEGIIKKIRILWVRILNSSSILTTLRMSLAFEQHHFNVDAIWSAPCIDVHTLIQRSLLLKSLKQYGASLLFPLLSLSFFFFFFFFAFLFILFFKFISKSRFIEFPGHQSESK